MYISKSETFNSCVYKCKLLHIRYSPIKNFFLNNIFMFYIDLDEVEKLKFFKLYSFNKTNLYSFWDKDHLQLGKFNLKENIIEYVKQNEVKQAELIKKKLKQNQNNDISFQNKNQLKQNLNNDLSFEQNKNESFTTSSKIKKIMLLTHLRTFGYIFNPVSFYFCFDEVNNPICVICEVGNTFGEMKIYFLDTATLDKDEFKTRQKKYFYVSPFSELDIEFDFKLSIPQEKLNIQIDDYKEKQKFFASKLTGIKKNISNKILFWYTLRFPFITLQVIFLIHYQALKLFLRKLPFIKKSSNLELQKDLAKWKNR